MRSHMRGNRGRSAISLVALAGVGSLVACGGAGGTGGGVVDAVEGSSTPVEATSAPEPAGAPSTASEIGGPSESERSRRATSRLPSIPLRGRCTVPLSGSGIPSWYARNFDRYAAVPVAGGGRIPLLVQDGVSDEQVRHVRSLLSSYLRPLPGRRYGSPATKRRVAREIVRSGAALLLVRDEEALERLGPPLDGALGQPLFGPEIVPPGPGFRDGLAPRRDATYEETLHFVQDFGIYVALRPFQRRLDTLTAKALARGVYNPPADVAADEGESIDNEYLAFGVETLYGLWAKDPQPQEYRYSTPAAMRRGDPAMVRLIESFLPATRRGATRPLRCG